MISTSVLETVTNTEPPVDTSLACPAMLDGLYQVAVNPRQLCRELALISNRDRLGFHFLREEP